LWSAVRTLPTCSLPVGEGAKRVTVVMPLALARTVGKGKVQSYGSSATAWIVAL
jgi:type 1 glutamine amidotransferase